MKGMTAIWWMLVLAGIVSAQQPQFNNDFSTTGSGPMPDRSEFGSYNTGGGASSVLDSSRSHATDENAQFTLTFDNRRVAQLQSGEFLSSDIGPHILPVISEIVFGFEDPIRQSVHSGNHMLVSPSKRLGDTLVFEFSESHLKAMERQTLRYRYSNNEIGQYRTVAVVLAGSRSMPEADQTTFRSNIHQDPFPQSQLPQQNPPQNNPSLQNPSQSNQFAQNPSVTSTPDSDRWGYGGSRSGSNLTPISSPSTGFAGQDRLMPVSGYNDNNRERQPSGWASQPSPTADRYNNDFKQVYARDLQNGIASDLDRERQNQLRAQQLTDFSTSLTEKDRELQLRERELVSRSLQVANQENFLRAQQAQFDQRATSNANLNDLPPRSTTNGGYRDQPGGSYDPNRSAANYPFDTSRERWASGSSAIDASLANRSTELRRLEEISGRLDDLQRENQRLRMDLIDANEVANRLQTRSVSSELPSQQARSASPLRDFRTSIGGVTDAQKENPLVNNNMSGPLFFMLLCSLGLNVYLGWISRNFYVRYTELADELRETFSASLSN